MKASFIKQPAKNGNINQKYVQVGDVSTGSKRKSKKLIVDSVPFFTRNAPIHPDHLKNSLPPEVKKEKAKAAVEAARNDVQNALDRMGLKRPATY